MKTYANTEQFTHIDLNTLKDAIETYKEVPTLLTTIYKHFLTNHKNGAILALLYLLKIKMLKEEGDGLTIEFTQDEMEQSTNYINALHLTAAHKEILINLDTIQTIAPNDDIDTDSTKKLDHSILHYAQMQKLSFKDDQPLLELLVNLLMQDHSIEEIIIKIIPLLNTECQQEANIIDIYINQFKQTHCLAIKTIENFCNYITNNKTDSNYSLTRLLTQLSYTLHNISTDTDLDAFNKLLSKIIHEPPACYDDTLEMIPTELKFFHKYLNDIYDKSEPPYIFKSYFTNWLKKNSEAFTIYQCIDEPKTIKHPKVNTFFNTAYKTELDNADDYIFSIREHKSCILSTLSSMLEKCTNAYELEIFDRILHAGMQFNLELKCHTNAVYPVLCAYITHKKFENILVTWQLWINANLRKFITCNNLINKFSSICYKNVRIIFAQHIVHHHKINAETIYSYLNDIDTKINFTSTLEDPFIMTRDYIRWLDRILDNSLSRDHIRLLKLKYKMLESDDGRNFPHIYPSILSLKFFDIVLKKNGIENPNTESRSSEFRKRMSNDVKAWYDTEPTVATKRRIANQLRIILELNEIQEKDTGTLDVNIIQNITTLLEKQLAPDYIKILFEHDYDIVFDAICNANPSDACTEIYGLLKEFPEQFFKSKQQLSLLLPNSLLDSTMLDNLLLAPHLKISKEFIETQNISIITRYKLYDKFYRANVNSEAHFFVRWAQGTNSFILTIFSICVYLINAAVTALTPTRFSKTHTNTTPIPSEHIRKQGSACGSTYHKSAQPSSETSLKLESV